MSQTSKNALLNILYAETRQLICFHFLCWSYVLEGFFLWVLASMFLYQSWDVVQIEWCYKPLWGRAPALTCAVDVDLQDMCFWGGGGIFWLWNNNTPPNTGMSWSKFHSVCKSLLPVTNPQEHIRHSTTDPAFETRLRKFLKLVFSMTQTAQDSNAK